MLPTACYLRGLTGFETSANYIEEAGPFEARKAQMQGLGEGVSEGQSAPMPLPPRRISVFERTISNMWWLVVIVNPIITTLSLGVLDLPTIMSSTNNILSVVGGRAGGDWLRKLVALDAIVVLSGGVLTSYVGVTGLIKQLASDRCLPSFLLHKNALFGSHHWIVAGFCVLTITLYSMTDGNVVILSGVFAVAFLLVLIMFALANMRLKFCRPRLPRGVEIGWLGVVLGFICMFIGLIGNCVVNPDLIYYFGCYVVFFFSVILLTFLRIKIVKILFYFVQQVSVQMSCYIL